MNGLSFYSNCLELSYDRLYFTNMEHKLNYFFNTDYDCISPAIFKSRFADTTFGLVVHSTLYPNTITNLPLGPYFTLYSKDDMPGVSFGFIQASGDKYATMHSVVITVLGSSISTSVLVQNDKLSFYGQGTLYGQDLYLADMIGNTDTSQDWDNMDIAINGWFIDLPSKLEDAVHEHLVQLSDSIDARIKSANISKLVACARYSAAVEELESAEEASNDAMEELNVAKEEFSSANDTLTLANAAVDNAVGELHILKMVLETLCSLEQCEQVCQRGPVTVVRFEDIFREEQGFCEELRTTTDLVQVPTSIFTGCWEWVSVCRRKYVHCGFFRCCTTVICSSVCTYVERYKFILTEVMTDVTQIRNVPCTKRIFVETVQHESIVMDDCASTVPDNLCVERNNLCEDERLRALDEINIIEQGLPDLLRAQINASAAYATTNSKLNLANLNKQIADQDLLSAQTQFDAASTQKDVSSQNYDDIVEMMELELQILDLINSASSMNDLLSITNITFQVTASQPRNEFPITVTGRQLLLHDLSVTIVYNFDTSFVAQSGSIVERIIEEMVICLVGRTRRSLHRRATMKTNDYGQEQFDVQCAVLNNLVEYLDNLQVSLENINSTKQAFLRNSSKLVYTLSNNTSTNASISINDTLLVSEFGISNFRNQTPVNRISQTSQIYKKIQNQLIKKALNVSASIGRKLMNTWLLDMETVHMNGSIGESECFGFADCLIVVGDLAGQLLQFGSQSSNLTFKTSLPDALRQLLKIIQLNQSITDSLNNIQPMISIVTTMKENGYWCAEVPIISTHPPTIANVSLNGTISLSCEARSSLPLSYQWNKNGVPIPNMTGHQLVLTNMQIFDEGNYTCEVRNDVGSVLSLVSIVQVYVLPQFYLTPVSLNVLYNDDNGAFFACNATSRPAPGWKWYHKSTLDQMWTVIDGEETNELLLSDPTEADIGYYYCLAYNYHGSISSEPVRLRLLKSTSRVMSQPLMFSLLVSNRNIGKRQVNNLRLVLSNLLLNITNFGNVKLENLQVILPLSDNDTYTVSVDLVGANTSSTGYGQSLVVTFENLLVAMEELDRVKGDLQNYFATDIMHEVNGESIQVLENSLTLDTPAVLCPPGHGLDRTGALCGKTIILNFTT